MHCRNGLNDISITTVSENREMGCNVTPHGHLQCWESDDMRLMGLMDKYRRVHKEIGGAIIWAPYNLKTSQLPIIKV